MPTGVDWIPIVAIVMGTLTVLIPLSIVALRFAIKPIAEAVAHMRSGGAAQEELAIMRQRLSLLEQQLGGFGFRFRGGAVSTFDSSQPKRLK